MFIILEKKIAFLEQLKNSPQLAFVEVIRLDVVFVLHVFPGETLRQCLSLWPHCAQKRVPG